MAEVMLYDRDGNPNTYDIGNGVRLYSEDGTARDFISASPVEATVQPDFSDGDMEVLPGEDKLFSKVTIEKPETLIPENISKNVEIAGIVGTLAGGAEIGTFGYLKYIIPIKQTIVKVSSYQLSTGSLTFKRTTTERIHVILFPPQSSTPSSRYWIHSVCYGCNYFSSSNYTMLYAHSASTFYNSSISHSGISSVKPAESVGNLTEITGTLGFNTVSNSHNHYPTGTYYGLILVTDTAHSGPATLIRENNYIESTGITVVTS